MIGLYFFCVMMSVFLIMILLQEAKLFILAVIADVTGGYRLSGDTDVFPDECVHPFPNYKPFALPYPTP